VLPVDSDKVSIATRAEVFRERVLGTDLDHLNDTPGVTPWPGLREYFERAALFSGAIELLLEEKVDAEIGQLLFDSVAQLDSKFSFSSSSVWMEALPQWANLLTDEPLSYLDAQEEAHAGAEARQET